MKDLRSQLMSQFGAKPPPDDAPAPPSAIDALHPDGHLSSPWLAELRRHRAVSGGPSVPAKPSFEASKQLTDKVAKALKNAGRSREARELVSARSTFLSAREKLAWGRVKTRFTDLNLSEKAYRALRQSKTDPVKVLAKLKRHSDAELTGMGAARLREALTGK